MRLPEVDNSAFRLMALPGIILISVLLTAFLPGKKPFPSFSYTDLSGNEVTETILKGDDHIVVLAHLGCPAAMLLIKDLQEDTLSKYRPLLILENTFEQIREFNDTVSNDWSSLRKYFKLAPLAMTTLAECDQPKMRTDMNGNLIIGKQCNKLGKTLKVKYSPTSFIVSGDGRIVSKKQGYLQGGSRVQRMDWLLGN